MSIHGVGRLLRGLLRLVELYDEWMDEDAEDEALSDEQLEHVSSRSRALIVDYPCIP